MPTIPPSTIDNTVFWVGKRGYCIWDYDYPEKNLRFIRQIDPTYYDYLLSAYLRGLRQKKNAQRAALALRAAYYHSLETFFSLLGATLQAPRCIPAWLQLARNETLIDIVREIEIGQFKETLLQIERVTWNVLSEIVHKNSPWSDTETVKHFSKLWSRFARDFLNTDLRNEYNGIKHGLRVAPGGFSLQAGVESEYGVPPPEDEMETIGQSLYGSSYFVVVPLVEENGKSNRVHYSLSEHSQNWDAISTARALQLTGVSINNLRSFLITRFGTPTEKKKFKRPQNQADFERPWLPTSGVNNLKWSFTIDKDKVNLIPRIEIEKILRHAHNAPSYDGSNSK